jgi:predicted MPP superfamily phosphohydrolase
MNFQIASDLHIEHLPENISINDLEKIIIPKAPILCLLGDIWNFNNKNYKLFFEIYSKKFKHILIIPGNHEYYCNKEKLNKSHIDLHMEKIFANTNVIFLNRKSIIIDNYKFIGATLWSYIPLLKT